MASHLEPIQHCCQTHNAALVIVHHWNQTGTGTGRARLSGAGPAEWGRVLASAAVDGDKRTEGTASVVRLKWEFIGDEIPDTELLIERRVDVTDPDDLTSPMTYQVTQPAPTRADTPAWNGPTECMSAITRFFTDHPDEELSKTATATRLRAERLSYRDSVVGDALERLAVNGTLDARKGPRNARLFRLHQEPTQHEL